MTSTLTDHLQIARTYAAGPLAPCFDPERRWSKRLATTGEVEVWLLSWMPGQGTDVHDHGGSAGAFLVVEGELTEEAFSGVRANSALLAPTQGRRFGAHHVHRVVNHGTRPAVSVHVYGPALTTMTRYVVRDGALVVDAVERAGVQW